MKQFPKTESFSLFSILLGIAGMALQSWLFSAADEKGLLLQGHIAGILSFILLAVVVAVNALFVKNLKSDGAYDHLFPQSPVAAAGCVIAAVGIGLSGFTSEIAGVLRILVVVTGVFCGLALIFAGYCRLQGRRPNCLIYAAAAVFLIFRTLAFCQVWSAQVQIQTYFFPLLATLSLLLAAYHRAALSADMKGCRQYLFFRQLALFCCLLSLSGGDRLFFFTGAVWMATDFCIPDACGKYAS